MDMVLSFYYYLLLLNELFKRNKQKEFNKKKSKQSKQTNTKQKSRDSSRRYILQIQVWLAALSKYA